MGLPDLPAGERDSYFIHERVRRSGM